MLLIYWYLCIVWIIYLLLMYKTNQQIPVTLSHYFSKAIYSLLYIFYYPEDTQSTKDSEFSIGSILFSCEQFSFIALW